MRPSEPLAALYEIAEEEQPKRSKYGNTPTKVDGVRFASKKESRRYRELTFMVKIGEIQDLKLQPRFPLKVNGKLICTYVADFSYVTKRGTFIVEDAKGHRTREYINKAKLFEALHGFKITEV